MTARQTAQKSSNVVGVQSSALAALSSSSARPRGIPALSERRWQQQVVQVARLYGWTWYHTHDSRRSQPGFPDLVLCRPPRLIAAELKTERGVVTLHQRAWLDILEACGIPAYVWRPRDLPDVQRILEAA